MSDHDELPKGWLRVTLGTIHRNDSEGIVPMKNPEQEFELFSVPSHATGKPEIVRGADIGSNKQTVRPNTVLLCKINPRINRVWVVNERGNRPQIASTEWIPFSVTEGVVPRYLAYYLQQNDFRDFLAGNASGVGGSLMRVKASTFDGYPFLLTPLNEQRRIVAKIEELFSDLDAGVAALERIRANLKRYRAAVLKAAVEGRLTEEWRTKHPNIEPASKLLERILAERRQKWVEDQLAKFAAADKTPPKGWREKYVEPAGPDTSKLPELPQGWCWATLDAISDLVGGITKDKKRANQPGMREVPYLRVANVQRGFLDLSEMKLIVASNEDIADLQLEIGDVLFTEGGDRDKLGRGWVWSGELPECIHQNHIFRARLLSKEIQPRFVSHHSNTFGQEWFTKAGKQTTNLASINLGILRRFPVPIPPVQEQEKIVAQLDEKLSEIEAAELIIDHSLKRSARLRQSILKRAFEGRLVPQDPTDEPADKLLERIRQQRESGNMKEGKNRSATRRTCGKVKSLPKSERNEPCC